MTLPSLASRVDAILGQADTVTAITFAVTCRECGGPFTVNRTRTTTQAREAHLTCARCGTTAVATVTLTTGGPAGVDLPRLPMAPLERHLAGAVADAAGRLGITRTTFYRLRRDGIPVDEADRLAVAAGLHPVQVWGRSYEVATGPSEESVA